MDNVTQLYDSLGNAYAEYTEAVFEICQKYELTEPDLLYILERYKNLVTWQMWCEDVEVEE